jgi:preprotein translocase subunit SecA
MEEPDQRAYLFGDPPRNAGDPSAGVAYDLMSDLTKQYLNPNVSADDWDLDNYEIQIKTIYDLDVAGEAIDFEKLTSEEVTDVIWEKLKVKYAAKEQEIGAETMRSYERFIMLNIIDAQWKDHLLAIDHLKQGIGLVGYGQKDPLVEYKKESFDMFQQMLDRIDTATIRSLFNLQVVAEQAPESLQQRRARRASALNFTGPNQGAAAAGEESAKAKPMVRDQPKVGRNEPCPCGSGKKFKKCHGV